MCSSTSPWSYSNFTNFNINIIINNHNIFYRNLIKLHRFFNAFSTQIHKSMRHQKNNLLPKQMLLGNESFKFNFFHLELMALAQNFEHHKTAIMPSAIIFFAWITKACNNICILLFIHQSEPFSIKFASILIPGIFGLLELNSLDLLLHEYLVMLVLMLIQQLQDDYFLCLDAIM